MRTVTPVLLTLSLLGTAAGVVLDGLETTVTPVLLTLSLLGTAADVSLDGLETTVTPVHLTLNLLGTAADVSLDGLETTVTPVHLTLSLLGIAAGVVVDGLETTVTPVLLTLNLLETAAGVSLDGLDTTVTPVLLTLNLLGTVAGVVVDGLETTVTSVPLDGQVMTAAPVPLDGLAQHVMHAKDLDSAKRVTALNVSRMAHGLESLILTFEGPDCTNLMPGMLIHHVSSSCDHIQKLGICLHFAHLMCHTSLIRYLKDQCVETSYLICNDCINHSCADRHYCQYAHVQFFKPLTPVTKITYGCTDQCFAVSGSTLHDRNKG